MFSILACLIPEKATRGATGTKSGDFNEKEDFDADLSPNVVPAGLSAVPRGAWYCALCEAKRMEAHSELRANPGWDPGVVDEEGQFPLPDF